MSKLLGNEILGENIKRIRLARGLTQEQTVARLQVLGSPLSRSTYSLIEMGRGNIFVNDLVGVIILCNKNAAPFKTNGAAFLCYKGNAGLRAPAVPPLGMELHRQRKELPVYFKAGS